MRRYRNARYAPEMLERKLSPSTVAAPVAAVAPVPTAPVSNGADGPTLVIVMDSMNNFDGDSSGPDSDGSDGFDGDSSGPDSGPDDGDGFDGGDSSGPDSGPDDGYPGDSIINGDSSGPDSEDPPFPGDTPPTTLPPGDPTGPVVPAAA